MPTQLVDDVRTLLRSRPLTMPERVLLLASLMPARQGTSADVVDELEAAVSATIRDALLPGDPDPAAARAAALRLVNAARSVIDHTLDDDPDIDPPAPLPDDARPKFRADVDA